MSHDKGKFSAEIGDDVIAEALRSVERHRSGATNEAAAQSPAPAAVSPEVEELRAQLEFSLAKGRELMEKVRDSHERMMRSAADLENYRKRAQKEKEEAARFGCEKLLRDLLPVVDNLDRAMEHARTSGDLQSLQAGLVLTRKQFDDALGKNGVKGFSAVGQPFDPHVHEAMQRVETDDVAPNHVVSELVRGYFLNDRLIRPAMVAVSMARTGVQGDKVETGSDAVQADKAASGDAT